MASFSLTSTSTSTCVSVSVSSSSRCQICTPSLVLSSSLRRKFKEIHDCNGNGSRRCLRTFAAKLPAGVEPPKEEPKLPSPFFGFTRTAEVWNSRACMIGLIGTFIVELFIRQGILQVIGVEVGKGLDLPL